MKVLTHEWHLHKAVETKQTNGSLINLRYSQAHPINDKQDAGSNAREIWHVPESCTCRILTLEFLSITSVVLGLEACVVLVLESVLDLTINFRVAS